MKHGSAFVGKTDSTVARIVLAGALSAIAPSLSRAQEAAVVQPQPAALRPSSADINSLLCDPDGWECDERFVSISSQTLHVRGERPGLLFRYTRRSRDLWTAAGEFDPLAYRPHAVKQVPPLNLTGYSELSFWVYVEGNAEEAFRIGFTGIVLRTSLRRNEWIHLRWDFAEDERIDLTNITSFFIQGINQGAPPSDPQEARVYLSDFRLTKALARHIVGWAPDPEQIVLSYCAHHPGEPVTALVAASHAGKRFSYTGPGPVGQGQVSGLKTSQRTEYAEIRFRAPDTPGKWQLTVEGGPSTTLIVDEFPYDEAVGKALTAVRAQRCGCASELHGPCHQDDAIRQDTGLTVDVAGGWHDEGASQYVRGTLLTTLALARYRRSHKRAYRLGLSPGAGDDLLAEVEWGARTLLKYEVEPGLFLRGWVRPFYCYTDNQRGTDDDRRITVHHLTPFYFWSTIETLALCSSVLEEPLKTRTRDLAERLWEQGTRTGEVLDDEELAYWRKVEGMLQARGAELAAAVAMHRLTGEASYVDAAVRTADSLLEMQDDSPPGDDALYGFFYRDSSRQVPYNGAGNSRSKDMPGRPLADLLKALPDHDDTPHWREALRRYAEGTLKPLARFNSPYGALAAGPFIKPLTDAPQVTMGKQMGDMWVYPIQFSVQRRREARSVALGSWETVAMLGTAAAMASIGQALPDDELTAMVHGVVRYILGANPFHVSYMRHFGGRWPEYAQMPNVAGMTLMFLGFTYDGRPYYNPYGTCANRGHPRFYVQREGTTYTAAALLEPCSYLEPVAR